MLVTILFILVVIWFLGVLRAMAYITFWNMESHYPDSKFKEIDSNYMWLSWFFKNPQK
jgi:hypothetical protein